VGLGGQNGVFRTHLRGQGGFPKKEVGVDTGRGQGREGGGLNKSPA
jgi:hypothetical protein